MLSTTSPARIAANQANALRSTGPTTEAGKARSRTNALKHGLTAQVIEVDGIGTSTPAIFDVSGQLDPGWRDAEIQRLMGQIARLHRIEHNLRAEAKFRADTHWSDDRTTDAQTLGTKLSQNPALIVGMLRRCPFGCSWLITQWEFLKLGATNPGGWNEIQINHAFDLLSIPIVGRDRSVVAAVAARVQPPPPDLTQLAIAEMMIADLFNQLEAVEEADEIAQRLAQHDLVDLPTPELARIRRYETALNKRLNSLVEQRQAARAVAAPVIPSVPAAPRPTPLQNEANFSQTNPTSTRAHVEPPLANPASVPMNNPKPTETTRNLPPTTTNPHPRR